MANDERFAKEDIFDILFQLMKVYNNTVKGKINFQIKNLEIINFYLIVIKNIKTNYQKKYLSKKKNPFPLKFEKTKIIKKIEIKIL